MIDWFRHRHGLSTDTKLAFVAKRCGMHRAFAVMVWSYLLERGSACEDRGSIAHLDPEEMGFSLDLEVGQVTTLMVEMTKRGLITGGRLTSWNKHHSGAGASTERVRDYRERQAIVEAERQETLRRNDETFPKRDETPYAREDGEEDLESEREGEGRATPEAKPAPKPKTGKRCPKLEDLALDDELRAFARREGRSPERELEKYRAHCEGKGARFKDYRAGFRNWLMSEFGRPPPAAANATAQLDRYRDAKLRREAGDRVRAEGLSPDTPEGQARQGQLLQELRTHHAS